MLVTYRFVFIDLQYGEAVESLGMQRLETDSSEMMACSGVLRKVVGLFVPFWFSRSIATSRSSDYYLNKQTIAFYYARRKAGPVLFFFWEVVFGAFLREKCRHVHVLSSNRAIRRTA